MKFFSSLVVLSLGFFAAVSPVSSPATAVTVRDTDPTPPLFPSPSSHCSKHLKKRLPNSHTPFLRLLPHRGQRANCRPQAVVPLLDELTDALNTATIQLSTNAPGDMGATTRTLRTSSTKFST
ncbi:hypothetical protein B0H14DRAFT_3873875 [Mycena olivaceomarginata]|nr:hypothetical protein B0H14DRAFT_3873875 [Mycena olivaceomarginata]